MIRCKREQENILLPLILCLAEKITFGFCHYICGVVKTFEKSHGIDEILVLFKYKFNLHTTVRCKLSTPMINPVYRSTVYTYVEWRRLT